MGQMTRLQIVQEGQLLAQRKNADTLATGWLQRWLDSVAASWPWPMNQGETIDVPVSSASITVGNGNGGITPKLLKVLDNIYIYDSTKSSFMRLRILPQLNRPQDRIQPANAANGMPQNVRVFQSTFGQWLLRFYPNPDKTYYLSVPYIQLPPTMAADTDIPWYPNDETMVQAVAFKTHEWFDGKDDNRTTAAQQLLTGALSNDRIRYGSVNGINDILQLDPVHFPRAKAP